MMVLRPRVVVDANVVVGELLKKAVQVYIAAGHISFYMTEKQLSEAEHEILRRLTTAQDKGLMPGDLVNTFLDQVEAALKSFIIVPERIFQGNLTLAALHVPTDPDDQPSAALALTLGCGVWTGDKAAFWGCGLPVWSFEALQRVYPAGT